MKQSKSIKPLSSFLGALLIVFIAAAYPRSFFPVSPNLPFVPADSPTKAVLPWAIYAPTKALVDLYLSIIENLAPAKLLVLDLATGYWKSEVLYTLTYNGMIDVLGRQEPLTCDQVAAELGLLADRTCQFMQAGQAIGLLAKNKKNEKFSLTRHGQMLRSDNPDTLRDTTLNFGRESFHRAWRAAGTVGLEKPESGMRLAMGQDLWSLLAPYPEEGAMYDRSQTQISVRQVGAILTSWSPPRPDITFCDIGGGGGYTTATFLDHYPEAKGIVFDQPGAANRTNAKLSKRGLSGRAKAVGGSFLEPLPASELKHCDVFFMKFIIHDWPDKESVTILKNIQQVAKPGSKLAVADQIVSESNGRGAYLTSTLSSLHMLALFGSKERTLPEFEALFQEAGLKKPVHVVKTRDIVSILEVELN